MRGAVDAGRGRGCMVEGVADKCARQLCGCRLAAPVPSCLWWPSFLGSLWFGGRSLRHKKDSRIGVAAAHAPDPYHGFRFHDPGGILLAARGVSSGVLVGDVVHLLLVAVVSTGVWLRGPRPRAAGLWSVFGFPLRLNLALVELFRSEEHTSELQSQSNLVCRLLLEKKKNKYIIKTSANRMTDTVNCLLLCLL